MFSNGTEYEIFIETQCFQCTRYRKGRCRIFNACEKARFLGEKAFPFDDLMDWEHYDGKACKSFTTVPIPRKRRDRKQIEGQMRMEGM
jgi:hypothetical protein